MQCGGHQGTIWMYKSRIVLLLINSHSGECTELAHYKLRKGTKDAINKSSTDGKTVDWEVDV